MGLRLSGSLKGMRLGLHPAANEMSMTATINIIAVCIVFMMPFFHNWHRKSRGK
jgi:hypothetical protein